jgi:multidrug resistance efflux pump
MVIITVCYLVLVYLLFFKFHMLPWNKITQGLTVLIGAVILTAFLVGLQGLTPASTQGVVTGRIVEIAPQVSGQVIEVPANPNTIIEAGDTLFILDATRYQAQVDDLKAKIALNSLRVDQFRELAEKSAGSQFALQEAVAEGQQLEAKLASAEFDLKNTVVLAPARGMVPSLFLKPGMTVSPAKSVLTFVDISELAIGALFQQKALQYVKAGDTALVNFPALPGQVFKTSVLATPSAISEGQWLASGRLPSVQEQRMTRIYPIFLALPQDYPENLRKVGLAATVYIHTEGAGVVGIVAKILQWVGTSLDLIM